MSRSTCILTRPRKLAIARACAAGRALHRPVAIRNQTQPKKSAATLSSTLMSRSRSSAWAKYFIKARFTCSGASRLRLELRRASTPIPAACANSSATCKPETT